MPSQPRLITFWTQQLKSRISLEKKRSINIDKNPIKLLEGLIGKRFMKISFLIHTLILLFLAACQSPLNRTPTSESSNFDSKKIALLNWAANHKILFQIDEQSFQHLSTSVIDDTCEKLTTPAWSEAVFNSLESLKKISGSKVKIHILDIGIGSEPAASVTQDLDGLTYLKVQYAEKLNSKVIESNQDIPCEKQDPSLIGKVRKDKNFVQPNHIKIRDALNQIKQSKTPERWNFKSDFLKLLAENMTLFRLTPDVSFEKSFDGHSLLSHFLNQQAKQISKNKTESLNYWLSEINRKSHSGFYLNLFTLKSDKNLTTGITAHQNSHGVAYPFMSYKIENGQFLISDLSKLEKCLDELKLRYRRSLASIGSDISTQSDSFLYPGYTCQESN